MKQWVSDEVWAQLDPRAGTLGRGQRRGLVAGAAAAAVLVAAGFAADRSVRAHLVLARDAGYQASTTKDSQGARILTRQFTVKNTGWTTVRVVGVGQDGPGLRLLGSGTSEIPGAQPPFDLGPGKTAAVVVVYEITDCAAVPTGPFPVAVRVHGLWGTQTLHVALPQEYTGPDGFVINPPMTEWQKAMADQACEAIH